MPEIVIVFFVLAIVETILSGTWNAWYFRTGIPLFTRRIPVMEYNPGLPQPEVLNEKMQSRWSESLIFRGISNNEMIFREKFFELALFKFKSTPIMHGNIEYSPRERAVIIKGRTNWFALSFPSMFIFMFAQMHSPMNDTVFTFFFIPFLFIILGLCYGLQLSRYKRLSAELESYYKEMPRS